MSLVIIIIVNNRVALSLDACHIIKYTRVMVSGRGLVIIIIIIIIIMHSMLIVLGTHIGGILV